jgi:hypothetical protein
MFDFLDDVQESVFGPSQPEAPAAAPTEEVYGPPAPVAEDAVYGPPAPTEEPSEEVVTEAAEEVAEEAEPEEIFEGMFEDEPEEEEAEVAIEVVAALPPEEQSAAIEDMDDQQFQALLAAVPEGDGEAMETIIGNCEDPDRKLQMWRDYHHARNGREVEGMFPEEEMGEDPDQMQEWGIRNEANGEAEVEIAAEIRRLEEDGEELTMEQVDDLIERKEREHALEMKYGVNITQERTTDEDGTQRIAERADGTPIVFTNDELLAVEAALVQIPEDMWYERLHVNEIRREDAGPPDSEGNIPGANNYRDAGRIEMYDLAGSAVEATDSDGNVVVKNRESAPDLHTAAPDGQYSDFEAVMLHELGHSAHNANLGLLDVYDDATDHIEGSQHAEYFAQDFKNAIANPETHAKKALNDQNDAVTAAQLDAQANPNDPAKQEALAAAIKKQQEWARMYSHMRDEVFDTDSHEEMIVQRMQMEGFSEDDVNDFRARAARLSTPEQLDRLQEEEYPI